MGIPVVELSSLVLSREEHNDVSTREAVHKPHLLRR